MRHWIKFPSLHKNHCYIFGNIKNSYLFLAIFIFVLFHLSTNHAHTCLAGCIQGGRIDYFPFGNAFLISDIIQKQTVNIKGTVYNNNYLILLFKFNKHLSVTRDQIFIKMYNLKFYKMPHTYQRVIWKTWKIPNL